MFYTVEQDVHLLFLPQLQGLKSFVVTAGRDGGSHLSSKRRDDRIKISEKINK